MQNDYESIMIMHVKKASVVQASLDIGQLTFPGLIFFFFCCQGNRTTHWTVMKTWATAIYIYIYTHTHTHTHTHFLTA